MPRGWTGLLLLPLLLSWVSPLAHAEGGGHSKNTIYMGASYTLPMYSLTAGTATTNSPGLGFLGGLVHEFPLGKSRFGLEIGLFAARQVFSLTSSGTTAVSEINVASIPILLRVWFLKDRVSLGVGGYGNTLFFTTSSGAQTIDAGLTGSLKIGLFHLGKRMIYLDLRAQYGLLDRSTSATEALRILDTQALLGFGF